MGQLLRFRELLAERYASRSMDAIHNRAFMRIFVQMHPESANAVQVLTILEFYYWLIKPKGL
jgi:hypothetical protein